MMSAIKEIVKDTYIFLRDMWFAIEDFFEFKVWPHRLESVSYTHLTLPTSSRV